MDEYKQPESESNKMHSRGSDDLSKAFAWLCIYLIASGFLSTAFAVLAFMATLFPTESMGSLLRIFALAVPLVLMGIGVMSVLPLSEYYYMREAGRNPAIARETVVHQKRKPEKRELGVLIGAAGITFMLRISPWDLFFIYFGQAFDLAIAMSVMVVAFALLVLFYRRKVRGMVKFDTY